MTRQAFTATLVGAALLSTAAAAQTPAPNATPAPHAPADPGRFLTQASVDQMRGSALRGLNVYNSDNEKIGDIKELVLGRNGKVEAVVIGVGGFLGLGEHNVGVPFDGIMFIDEPRNAGLAGPAGQVTSANGLVITSPAPAPTAAPDPAAAPGAATPGAAGSSMAAPSMAPSVLSGAVLDPVGNRTGAETSRARPDHAMLNLSKDQLKAAPAFRYAR